MFDSYQTIFDQRGSSYHAAMALAPRAREEEFAVVVEAARLAPGERLCDMPSGGGYLQSYVGTPGVSITSVDNSPAFYTACLDSGVGNARLAPLEATGFAEATFDKVISLAGMHHIADRPAVFTEAARILVVGGVYCIADVAAGSSVASFLNGFVDRNCSLGHVGSFVTDAWAAELSDSGFRIEEYGLVQMHWNFPDTDAMSRFCKLLFGLDLASHGEVLAGLGETLGYTVTPGGCRLPWELTLIRCVKR